MYTNTFWEFVNNEIALSVVCERICWRLLGVPFSSLIATGTAIAFRRAGLSLLLLRGPFTTPLYTSPNAPSPVGTGQGGVSDTNSQSQ